MSQLYQLAVAVLGLAQLAVPPVPPDAVVQLASVVLAVVVAQLTQAVELRVPPFVMPMAQLEAL